MKIKFHKESVKKIESNLSYMIKALYIKSQTLSNIAANMPKPAATQGNFYKFKFLYPFEQNDKVSEMVKDFTDSFIMSSKQYQLDDKVGVLIIHSIKTELKETEVDLLIEEIFNKEDCYTVLLIKHTDEFVSKLASMKIKYFDIGEFQDVDNLFKNEMTEMFDE